MDLSSAASKQGEEHTRVFAAWRQKARVTYDPLFRVLSIKNPAESGTVRRAAGPDEGRTKTPSITVIGKYHIMSAFAVGCRLSDGTRSALAPLRSNLFSLCISVVDVSIVVVVVGGGGGGGK